MSRNKSPVLNEKHLKALALLDKGGLSIKDIAKECGWKPDYLYELYEGDTSKAGSVASLFVAECRKIDKKLTTRIKNLSKSNKTLAHKLINRILTDIASKKKRTEHDDKLVGTLMNCISKDSPSVEIGSVSYSYTKGYTPEQLTHEFRRLQTLAGESSNRGAVSSTSEGGEGSLSKPSNPRSRIEKEL